MLGFMGYNIPTRYRGTIGLFFLVFKFKFIAEGTSVFLRCIYVKVYIYNYYFRKPGLVTI